MPENIPKMPAGFFSILKEMDIPSVAFETCRGFIGGEIPAAHLESLCKDAFNFPVPVVQLNDKTFVAELFHGPTLAFKDFGARFMARVMSFLNRDESKKLTILVATSGDTGGAVADGFFNVEGVEVYILYPSGGVSELQEKQLTTYGNNIHAIEVQGTFDDCQHLVKSAFLDKDLSNAFRLSSANSINIARLIPQMIYYFVSYAKVNVKDIYFSVPSGNFGNLTAGLFAKRLGLPVKRFIAATNANESVVEYLSGKGFHPHKSIATISNAMDVGNPSNFGRMIDLFKGSVDEMRKDIIAFSISDAQTEATMNECYETYGYVTDPHGAVGLRGWQQYSKEINEGAGIILETAHPAKFIETVERVLGLSIQIPEQLAALRSKSKSTVSLSASFEELKAYLMSRI